MSGRRIFLLAAVLALAVCLSSSPLHAEAVPPSIGSAQDAEAFVRILLNGDAAALDDIPMTNQMAAAMKTSGGFKAVAQSLVMLGTADSIGPAWQMEASGLTIYRVPCRFQLMPLDLMLSVHDSLLAGLVTAEYTEPQVPAPETAGNRELSLALPCALGDLPGTLALPAGEGPFPAVVLVHGSGPNDRDETMLAQKPFRDLADGLSAQGIAVYRYDKRTYVYGAALMEDLQLTLKEETIDDAAAAVQLLRQREEIDPGRIFVLGHSLGATAIPAIDQALRETGEPVRGYILMAGSPRQLDELMREQYDHLYSLLPAVTEEQQAEKDRLFAQLDLLKDLDSLPDSTAVAGAYAAYWRWLRGYDVLSMAGSIAQPCLVLQGEEDYQVTMKDYALWQDALADRPNWTFRSYPGLIHTFTAGEKTEGSSAYTRPLHVDAQVIDDIAAFILEH